MSTKDHTAPPRAQASKRQSSAAPDWSLSPIPRYIQLSTLFRNRIASGEWRVGERIPNVDVLAENLGVARETVRQALGLLEEQGLLDRARAKGTFVRASPGVSVAHKLEINWSSLTMAHEGAELELLSSGSTRELPGYSDLTGRPAPRYRTMKRRHLRSRVPYLLSTLYLDERIYRKVPARRFLTQPTLHILREVADLETANGQQILTIGAADVDASALLEIPVNSPVGLSRRQITSSDGTIIYLGVGIYRGDSLRLEMTMR